MAVADATRRSAATSRSWSPPRRFTVAALLFSLLDWARPGDARAQQRQAPGTDAPPASPTAPRCISGPRRTRGFRSVVPDRALAGAADRRIHACTRGNRRWKRQVDPRSIKGPVAVPALGQSRRGRERAEGRASGLASLQKSGRQPWATTCSPTLRPGAAARRRALSQLQQCFTIAMQLRKTEARHRQPASKFRGLSHSSRLGTGHAIDERRSAAASISWSPPPLIGRRASLSPWKPALAPGAAPPQLEQLR